MDAKKVVLIVIVVFILFWMFTDPSGLAATTSEGAVAGWGLLVSLFEAIIRFLGVLF